MLACATCALSRKYSIFILENESSQVECQLARQLTQEVLNVGTNQTLVCSVCIVLVVLVRPLKPHPSCLFFDVFYIIMHVRHQLAQLDHLLQ